MIDFEEYARADNWHRIPELHQEVCGELRRLASELEQGFAEYPPDYQNMAVVARDMAQALDEFTLTTHAIVQKAIKEVNRNRGLLAEAKSCFSWKCVFIFMILELAGWVASVCVVGAGLWLFSVHFYWYPWFLYMAGVLFGSLHVMLTVGSQIRKLH